MKKAGLYFILMLGIVVMSFPARAADIVAQMDKLMVDLPGFEAQTPQSASMNAQGMKMMTSTRTYTKEGVTLNSTFIAGVGTESYTDGMGDINISTSDMRAKTQEINGFKVITNYDIPGNTGGVLVWLGSKQGDQGALMFSFDGMDDKEALKLAEKFDWKAFRELAKQFMQ